MSTGVVPVGGGVYMLSKNGTGVSVGSNLKADLYREANAWCEKQGLVMVPVSESGTDGVAGLSLGSAEIKFRAVKPGDRDGSLRTDGIGATAQTYDELAKQYDAQGRKDMADAARARAEVLRR